MPLRTQYSHAITHAHYAGPRDTPLRAAVPLPVAARLRGAREGHGLDLPALFRDKGAGPFVSVLCRYETKLATLLAIVLAGRFEKHLA